MAYEIHIILCSYMVSVGETNGETQDYDMVAMDESSPVAVAMERVSVESPLGVRDRSTELTRSSTKSGTSDSDKFGSAGTFPEHQQ